MSQTIIKVENLSKSYTINHEGRERYTALRDVITNKAKRLFSFPLALKSELNKPSSSKEEFWALKDVNFDISQGDRVGIIGRNGAGKSTLLKVLSRITEPTSGKISIKGRVASLLEVGTGFHPELTGRENIFLNGAILGMSRSEIKRHFDEIVDFAEVERFLDTPVKRYSSGMYVRLAFAVAAHLEPEVLIVDEVLAVGDSQFQKKCLGKMEAVSNDAGRTVLFVSHNMQAIKQLCNRGILLNKGEVHYAGDIGIVTEKYLEGGYLSQRHKSWSNEEAPGNDSIRIREVQAFVEGKSITDPLMTNDDIQISISFENKIPNVDLDVTWDIFDIDAAHVCHVGTLVGNGERIDEGVYEVSFMIPKDLLNNKIYFFNVTFGIDQRYVAYKQEGILSIEVEDGIDRVASVFHKFPGSIHPKFNWTTEKIQGAIGRS